MIGAMKNCNKQTIVDNYISEYDPYIKGPYLKFDLRAYSAYIKQHQLKAQNITPEILEKFMIE